MALQNRNANPPPIPRSAPAADTEVTDVRQKGRWFQFRIKLENQGPSAKNEYDSYSFSFNASIIVEPSPWSSANSTEDEM